MQNPRYWLRKKAQRKTGYPVATIAYYGRDDTFASKVVVGIVRSEKEKDPLELNIMRYRCFCLGHGYNMTPSPTPNNFTSPAPPRR